MQPLNMMSALPQAGMSSVSPMSMMGGSNPMQAMGLGAGGAQSQAAPGMGSFGGAPQSGDPNQMMMQMMGMMAMMMMGMMAMMMQMMSGKMGGAQQAQGADPAQPGGASAPITGGTGTFDGKEPKGPGVQGAVTQGSRLAGLDFRQDTANSCGLATISNIAKMQGKNISEQQVIAKAKEMGLFKDGGLTTPQDRERIARALGVTLNTKNNANMNDITAAAESGKPAIIAVNNQAISPQGGPGGDLNHVVSLLGVKRGAGGKVEGYYIVDTSNGDQDGVRLVSADQMQKATGGNTFLQS